MNLPTANNVYIYRAGVRERIVFSVIGKEKIIHDVITASELMMMKNK